MISQRVANRIAILLCVSCLLPVLPMVAAESVKSQFVTDVVPVLTKLGCNSGGCHGKATGQNGFKLSLLGFEPGADYQALVKEARAALQTLKDPVTKKDMKYFVSLAEFNVLKAMVKTAMRSESN